MKRYQKILFWVGMILMALGLISVVVFAYHPENTEGISLKPVWLDLGEPREGGTLMEPPAISLTLPVRILQNGSGKVSLSIIHSPGSVGDLNTMNGQVLSRSEIEQEWRLVYETRLDIAPALTQPDGILYGTMEDQDQVHFEWDVYPINAGIYEGNLWIFLNLIHIESGDQFRQAVFAKKIELVVEPVLGMSRNHWTRIAATLLILGGMMILFVLIFHQKNK